MRLRAVEGASREIAETVGEPAEVLRLEHITKRFGRSAAVDDVSFTVRSGEVFTLLGPSGCGKTTTLRLVAGLEPPDQGAIYLKGQCIASGDGSYGLPPERRNMGMVAQSYAIWPHMSVAQNVAFPLELRRVRRREIEQRVQRALELVGLGALAQRPATALSGGQQQRVALARALVYEPAILLLDEPLSNLDAKLREQMRLEIRALQRRLGITVLFVTHDQSEALLMSDVIGVMHAGRFEQVGTPREIYEHPRTPFVRDFVGRSIVLGGVVSRRGPDLLVELAGEGGGLELADDSGRALADGAAVVLACRPEDIQVEAPTPLRSDQLLVRVREVAYLGDHVEYGVELAGRAVTVAGPRSSTFGVGETMALRLDPAAVTLWPA